MSRSTDPDTPIVFAELYDFLQQRGFKSNRAHTNWRLDAEDVVCIVNIQRLFAHARRYGINLAVWVRQAGEPPTRLRESLCHVRCRAESLWKEKSNYMKQTVLDLDATQISAGDRKLLVGELTNVWISEFLMKTGSKNAICEAHRSGYFKDKFFHRVVGEICEVA
jgi:Domain of unknown function (DUF4304)